LPQLYFTYGLELNRFTTVNQAQLYYPCKEDVLRTLRD
jgi:hypothetical protein